MVIKTTEINSKLYIQLTQSEEEVELPGVLLSYMSVPKFQISLSSVDIVLLDHSKHDKMTSLISTTFSQVAFDHHIQVKDYVTPALMNNAGISL